MAPSAPHFRRWPQDFFSVRHDWGSIPPANRHCSTRNSAFFGLTTASWVPCQMLMGGQARRRGARSITLPSQPDGVVVALLFIARS